MRFHLLSDLHLEFSPLNRVPIEGDVLLLAGDITTAGKLHLLLETAHNYRAAGKSVLFVPGNHEFYGHVLPTALRAMRRTLQEHGVTLLHNRVVDLGGVRVFGATLWTDYNLYLGRESQARQQERAAVFMHDHRAIGMPSGTQYRTLTPADALRMHTKSVRLLRSKLLHPYEGQTLVMSHHGVHRKSIHEQYARSMENGAFVSDLHQLIDDVCPDVMVHGHVHNSADYTVCNATSGGSTRVITNPRGYPMQFRGQVIVPPQFENPEYRQSLTFELGAP